MTAPPALADVYRDLHANPELGFQEARTAGIVAARLTGLGFDVTTAVGGTGVVGILRNGDGPTVLLRADMDALPVREDTGLPYASTRTATDRDGRTVPVMHACGHDMHVACLLGAAADLAGTTAGWSGTVATVFQPAEESGQGAAAMIDDGLFGLTGRPDVVLGQHVAPLPAGMIALTPGVAFANADSIRIVLKGRGAHGSRPEVAIDPVVMAAATVLRLQTIVSREVAGSQTAVLTVGAVRAGTAGNIIPAEAELLLNLRTFDEQVRQRVLAAIERVVRAEAAASGATEEPEVSRYDRFPALVNDAAASAAVRTAFDAAFGPGTTVDAGPATGSEDVGLLATSADCPLVYWLLGGADPAGFDPSAGVPGLLEFVSRVPSNHSPCYAPVVEPTLTNGVAALLAATGPWLRPAG
jgi:hippurate hydrolase